MSDSSAPPRSPDIHEDRTIDLGELCIRIMKGLPTTLGMGLVGLVISAIVFITSSPFTSLTTQLRVAFAFEGYDLGLNPDKSVFVVDGLISPYIVTEALRKQNLILPQSAQSVIRRALTIEGVIPISVVKERDRLQEAGFSPAPFRPDEFKLSLTLPKKFKLTVDQRQRLLSDVVEVYSKQFQRTYVSAPESLGAAFESLEGTDYFDYELVLSRESINNRQYLAQMMEKDSSFRSPRTNMSFADLVKQNELFTQNRLNETLGLIRQFGLSTNRKTAMIKMDYYLQSLEDKAQRTVEEEKLVTNLLAQAQERAQGHVLGIKSQGGQKGADSPIIDQGLIDSLLANDAYNFLVREALRAGLETRKIQSEISILQERRRTMQGFIDTDSQVETEAVEQLEASLVNLREAYDKLIANIHTTQEDYQRQEFGDAIRISMQPTTQSFYPALAKAGLVGGFLGAAAGIGLSLLGLTGGRREFAASE